MNKKIFLFLYALASILLYNSAFGSSEYISNILKEVDNLQRQNKYDKAIKLINKSKTGKIKISSEEFQILSDKAQETEDLKKEFNFKNLFVKEYDPYKKMTIYKPKKIVPYSFEAKITTDNNKNIVFYFLIEVRHVGQDWLYPNTISFLYNNEEVWEIKPENNGNKVNCSGYSCVFYENTKISLGEKEIEVLSEVVNSNYQNAKVYGKNGNMEIPFYPDAKKHINNMIKLYYMLISNKI